MEKKKISVAKSMIAIVIFVLFAVNAKSQQLNLLLPANGDSCIARYTTFFSDTLRSASSYAFQISTSSSFTAGTFLYDVSNLSTPIFTATFTNWDTRYYWRATATRNDSLFTSSSWSFTTMHAPPVLTSPVNGATCVSLRPVFAWNSVPGATAYKLEASYLNNFASPFLSAENITSTSFTTTIGDPIANVYWRVKAVYSNCQTDWSSPFTFLTNHLPPIIASPLDKSKGVSFNTNLIWNQIAGVNFYKIQVSTSSNFSSTFLVDQTVPSTTLSTQYIYPVSLPANYNVQYFWRVSASFSDCYSDWTLPFTFRTPYQSAVPNDPPNNSQCLPLNYRFKWSTVPLAQKYRMQISSTPIFNNLILDRTGISTTFTDITLPNYASTYFWRVRGDDTINTGEWSTTFSLTSTIKPPVYRNPMKDSTGYAKNITFKWENFSQGSKYQMQIGLDSNFINVVTTSPRLDTNIFTYTVPNYNTIYYWRVSATYSTCESGWSSHYGFKTSVSPPSLQSPSDYAIKVPLMGTFQWNTVPGATFYDIETATDSLFTKDVAGIAGITANQTLLKNFKPSTKYFWHVRSGNSEGRSIWSAYRHFTTGIQGPQIPVLLSPPDNSKKQPVNIDFIWKKSARAIYYHLQVSDTNNFATFKVDSAKLTDTTFTLNLLKNYETYYWRVAAVNDSGQTVWVGPWSFRTIALKPTEAPTLWTPADKVANTDINLLFKWDPVARAENYKLQAAKDSIFPNGAIQFDKSDIWNTQTILGPFEYDMVYYWRVLGYNEAGDGPWSVKWSFKTTTSTGVTDIQKYPFESQAQPNPAGNQTTIRFHQPISGNVTIKLFDVLGNELATLRNEYLAQGEYFIIVDTKDLSNGIYWYTMNLGNLSETKLLNIAK
ncbi:MAG: type sorting protein [Ignavibacteria bacterium]|nr:type sorting protein [Ignavibacteria bacterium]